MPLPRSRGEFHAWKYVVVMGTDGFQHGQLAELLNRLYAVQDQCCLWNGYCTIHPQPPITRPWHCMLPFALRKVTRGIIDNYIFLKQQFSHKLVHALIHVLTCNTSNFTLMMWIWHLYLELHPKINFTASHAKCACQLWTQNHNRQLFNILWIICAMRPWNYKVKNPKVNLNSRIQS